MARHPYETAAAYRRWGRAVATPAVADVDPVMPFASRITRQDRIVTAGSCFAQHIARHLRQNGFTYLDAEPAHPLLSPAEGEAFNYGLFSARYANIYTTRQLLQLLRRAYGRFAPVEDIWPQDGAYFDPFRPAIQPGGFATRREYELDRAQHFAAIRRAFETMDVFVFTLGLTEAWVSAIDGAVFPTCPGTIAGTFDATRHHLRNFTAAEVTADLEIFITELRAVNPDVQIILTVSPVPLAATALDRHVLVSTAYSKAVLRVAAEQVCRHRGVTYFPSYEIITGAHTRGRYFAADLRSITEEGVGQVMRLFFRHATTGADDTAAAHPIDAPRQTEDFDRMRAYVEVLCEEGALDPA